MTRTMKTFLRQNKEPYRIPRRVQDVIPIKRIWDDGLMLTGGRYSMVYQFSDINYFLASRDVQEKMFASYGRVLNGFDSGVLHKIMIISSRINQRDLLKRLQRPIKPGILEPFCHNYNDDIIRNTSGSNGYRQDKYLTIAVYKRSPEEARLYFNRRTQSLKRDFQAMGVTCTQLNATERMRILHDFYRPEDQEYFLYDLATQIRRGDDPVDYICPGSIERHTNYLIIGDKYCRALYLKSYANNMSDIMIPELTDMSRNMIITQDLMSVPTDEGIREVNRKILSIDTDAANYSRRQISNNNFNVVIPRALEQMREESNAFLDGLSKQDQKMFFGMTTIVHTADSLEELNSDSAAIAATAQGRGCQIEVMRYQQQDGLNTALPFGVSKHKYYRTMDTECASILVPFRVQEIQHPNGILMGVNTISKNLILVDRKRLTTPHGFFLGYSGGGKSAAMKITISRLAAATDDDIIIIDAEREYGRLTKALGGEILEISPNSNTHINPLDVADGFDDENVAAAKSRLITCILEQQAGEGRLDGVHTAIIDRCTNNIYRRYLKDPKNNPMPLLSDWRAEVMRQPEPEARELALISEYLTEGSMNVFSHPTNVEMNNRIVTLDLYEMGEQLRPSALVVALEAVQNRVVENRRKGKYTWVFIEEAYLYFKYQYSADILYKAFKRWRKYYGILTAATQNVEECLNSEAARLMLANSDFLMLFSQAPTDQKQLAELLNISKQQLGYVQDVEPGTGLMKCGSMMVPFTNQIPTDSELYKLITTKPSDGIFGDDRNG